MEPGRSERLVLEPLVRGHASRVFAPLSDARLYTFMPKDPPVDLASLTERFARLEARQSPDGTQAWLNWVARLSEPDVRGAPYVGLFEATVEGDVAHVAYFVFSAFQRRGIAREGLEAVMSALERTGGIRRFVAEIDTRNIPSIRLVRSLGFALECTMLNADHFKGAPSDEHRFVRRGRASTS